VILGIHAVGV